MKSSLGWGLLTLWNSACVVELCYAQRPGIPMRYIGLAYLPSNIIAGSVHAGRFGAPGHS